MRSIVHDCGSPAVTLFKMEFGQFDDSFFEEIEEKQEKRNVGCYTANQCPPEHRQVLKASAGPVMDKFGSRIYVYTELVLKGSAAPKSAMFHTWFVDPTIELTSETGRQILKYRADWFYHRRKFTKAVETYSKLLELVPLSNAAMRRDIRESLARSHVGLQSYDKALVLALELCSDAQNFEQRTSSIDFLSQIHEKTGNWTEMFLCLERLLILHPQSAATWHKLASIYAHIYTSEQKPRKQCPVDGELRTSIVTLAPDLPCDMGNLSLESQQPGELYSNLPTEGCVFGASSLLQATTDCACGQQCISPRDLVATCLIRTSILLHSSKYGLAEWVKRKLECDQKQVKDKLSTISFDSEKEEACTAFMLGDLQPATNADEDKSTENSPEQMIQESNSVMHDYFLRKWTAWRRQLNTES